MTKNLIVLLTLISIFSCREKEGESRSQIKEILLSQQTTLDSRIKSLEQTISELNIRLEDMASKESRKVNYLLDYSGWKQINHECGFSIKLPEYFKKGEMSAEDGDVQYFINDLDESIEMQVESWAEAEKADVLSDFIADKESGSVIMQKILRDNGYEIHLKDWGNYKYKKALLKGRDMFTLTVKYPEEYKEALDLILPRISKSFR